MKKSLGIILSVVLLLSSLLTCLFLHASAEAKSVTLEDFDGETHTASMTYPTPDSADYTAPETVTDEGLVFEGKSLKILLQYVSPDTKFTYKVGADATFPADAEKLYVSFWMKSDVDCVFKIQIPDLNWNGDKYYLVEVQQGTHMYTAQYHYESRYDEEAELWAEIAQLNMNNTNALTGLGKSAYRRQAFAEAMEYFKLAEDRTNYSAAFKMYRSQRIGILFPYLMTGILGFCVLLFVYSLWRKRHPAKASAPHSYRGTLQYSRYVVFHPFDGFWDLKCEKRGSMKAAITLLGLACIVMAVYSRFTGFIFTTGRVEEINLLVEALKVAAPLLLFCVCNWCVTSLMNGEGKFRDIVMASCYALTPMIWLLPLATIFSHFLIQEDAAFLQFLVGLALFWTVILLICANRQIHDYTMGKTLAVLLITLLVMVIVLFLAVLAFALIQQFLAFIRDLSTEISMRL